jgi:hypothetical protein
MSNGDTWDRLVESVDGTVERFRFLFIEESSVEGYYDLFHRMMKQSFADW